MTVSRVIVLGCGPAGLIAAHAAAVAGVDDIRIYSKPRKSFMKGAQYLHAPIPGATPIGAEFKVAYTLDGSAEGYRDKVYGKGAPVVVSPETLVGVHSAWDIRQTYDWLWETYGSYVQNWEASYQNLQAICGMGADLIFSSIPAPLLCAFGHPFVSENIWSTDKAMHGNENTVMCNGNDVPGWYRSALVHGWGTTEWPGNRKPPVTPLWDVVKPIRHNCGCFPDIIRIGRYGKWTKGVLSHEVYGEVFDRCVTPSGQ